VLGIAKATQAAAAEATEASTAAPSCRIDGTCFSISAQVAKKPGRVGSDFSLKTKTHFAFRVDIWMTQATASSSTSLVSRTITLRLVQ
jgi:hypothetical protein